MLAFGSVNSCLNLCVTMRPFLAVMHHHTVPLLFGSTLRTLFNDLSENVTVWGVDIDVAVRWARKQFYAIISRYYPNMSAFRDEYLQSISFDLSLLPAPSPPPGTADDSIHTHTSSSTKSGPSSSTLGLAVGLGTPVGLLVLGVVLGLVLMAQHRARLRHSDGHAPPKPAPETTIVVTDVSSEAS